MVIASDLRLPIHARRTPCSDPKKTCFLLGNLQGTLASGPQGDRKAWWRVCVFCRQTLPRLDMMSWAQLQGITGNPDRVSISTFGMHTHSCACIHTQTHTRSPIQALSHTHPHRFTYTHTHKHISTHRHTCTCSLHPPMPEQKPHRVRTGDLLTCCHLSFWNPCTPCHPLL